MLNAPILLQKIANYRANAEFNLSSIYISQFSVAVNFTSFK